MPKISTKSQKHHQLNVLLKQKLPLGKNLTLKKKNV
jgi:hypothetical protein